MERGMGSMTTVSWTSADDAALQGALDRLRHPSFAERLNRTIGKPIHKGLSMLPAKVQNRVATSVESALSKALDWVLLTMDLEADALSPKNHTHRWMAASTGFAGGFFGGWTALAEIPVSTGIMLRTIADIARSEGEDLSTSEARLSCLLVLGFDGTGDSSAQGNVVDERSGVAAYFAVRSGMNAMVQEAVTHLTGSVVGGTGLAHMGRDTSLPVLMELTRLIATRYGVIVSEELALQWVPVIGGLGGATVNYLFTQHFQNIAHAHFTIRRLERTYGVEVVQQAIVRLRLNKDSAPLDVSMAIMEAAPSSSSTDKL